MNQDASTSVYENLSEGIKFHIGFSKLLLEIDSGDFILGIIYRFLNMVFTFISMIFPVKVILFLSPEQGVPNFLYPYFDNKTEYIGFLCVVMSILIVVSYVFSNLVKRISKSKVDKILAYANVNLPKKRVKKIKRVIDMCISMISLLLFILVCSVVLLFVYLELLVIGVLLIVGSVFIFFMVDRYTLIGIERINKKPSVAIELIGNSIFISSFFYIVYDALINKSEVDLIVMVVGLIAVRKLSSMLSRILILSISINNIKSSALDLKAIES